MSKIEIREGCLLDAFDKGEVNHIAHVVNCQGVMGSGIAKSIRLRYPKVFQEYKDYIVGQCHIGDRPKPKLLGDTTNTRVDGGKEGGDGCLDYKIVHNIFAQYNFGTDKRQLNYGAFSKGIFDVYSDFWLVNNMRSGNGLAPLKLGLPFKIGSDRAGGDWEIVLELIEFAADHFDETQNTIIYKL